MSDASVTALKLRKATLLAKTQKSIKGTKILTVGVYAEIAGSSGSIMICQPRPQYAPPSETQVNHPRSVLIVSHPACVPWMPLYDIVKIP